MSQVDIMTGESIKGYGWKDIKRHPDSSFLSDMTGTRDKGVGTRAEGTSRLLKNAYLLRCATSFVTAAYAKVRLIPQDLRALHRSIFEQPV